MSARWPTSVWKKRASERALVCARAKADYRRPEEKSKRRWRARDGEKQSKKQKQQQQKTTRRRETIVVERVQPAAQQTTRTDFCVRARLHVAAVAAAGRPRDARADRSQ